METTMRIKDGRTTVMLDEVQRCEDINDLRSVLDNNSQYYVDWKAYINYLVENYGFSYRKFAKKCGINHSTIASWCEKGQQPRGRNQFIQLGFGLKMSLDELNEFLQRYGKYPKLYPKNIEDAIFIFALNQDLPFESAIYMQNQIIHILELSSQDQEGKLRANKYFDTAYIQDQLLSLNDAKEFERFVVENSSAFLNSYEKLISFLDAYIKIASIDYTEADPQESINRFLCNKINSPKLINHYNMLISRLRNHRIVPKRYDLIALGIYLDMSLDHVNQMLSMAGMEHLCAKDRLECVLIYAIENALLENPDIEFSNALLLRNLSENAELKENCRNIINRYELNLYKSVEEDGGVLKYVQEALKQMNQHDISEFSHLLEY